MGKMSKSYIILLVSIISLFIILFLIGTWLGIPKDDWINDFKKRVSVEMCQFLIQSDDTKQYMQQYNITYARCIAIIPKSVDICIAKYSNQLPSRMNTISGHTWSEKIGKCINAVFYDRNIGKAAP